jgi:hypothetical protein
MDIWPILRPFGICCGYLVNFMGIWYLFLRFGKLYQEKSGNPAPMYISDGRRRRLAPAARHRQPVTLQEACGPTEASDERRPLLQRVCNKSFFPVKKNSPPPAYEDRRPVFQVFIV